MQHINRRQLLKTTGAGAGIALGAGATSGNETAVTSSEPVQTDQELVSTFGAEATAARIALDTDNPEDQRELATGEPLVTIDSGEIHDNGDLVVPSDQITVPDLIDVVLGLDPKQIILDFLEDFSIQEDIIDKYVLDEVVANVSDFLFKLELSDTQAAAIGEFVGILSAEFDALPKSIIQPVVTGLLENPTEEAIHELLDFIAEQVVDGIDEIDSMDDVVTAVMSFIDGVDTIEGLEDYIYNKVQNLDLENILSMVSVDVEPDPVEGTVDPTVESPPEVLMTFPLENVTLATTLDTEPPLEFPEVEFNLGIELTTGQSNALQGEFVPDVANDAATGTAVDNEFTLDITEFDLVGLIDGVDLVGLIETIFELLAIDPADYDFDIPQFVEDVELPSVIENAELLSLLDGFIQDEPGRHAIEADLDMSFEDLEAVLGIELGPPQIPGFEGEPQDHDGDGLFEDIDGSGSFDIFDVQALFSKLDSDAVQNNPEAFNFNEDENPDGVSIFDVQGLFEKLQEQ